MTKVYFDGITNMGACVKCACVCLPDDYTMWQLVSEIGQNYQAFKLTTMKRFVKISETQQGVTK